MLIKLPSKEGCDHPKSGTKKTYQTQCVLNSDNIQLISKSNLGESNSEVVNRNWIKKHGFRPKIMLLSK